MKIPNLMRAAAATPWCVAPEKLDSVIALLNLRASGGRYTDEEIRAAIGGEPMPPSRASTGSGIAVIPLTGLIVPRASAIDESSGVFSLARFNAWFDAAMVNDQVSTIVLDIDSPGGQVGLVAETASKILNARGQGKKIVACVNTLAASAAYWIASAADEIVISPSGEAGSIGVIMVHCDESKADELMGLTYTVLTAGKYKGEGNPFEALDDEARAAIEGRLQGFYDMFVTAVAKGRGVKASDVRSGFGQGRVLGAKEAVAAGLADRVASFDETMAKLGSKRAVRSGARATLAAPTMSADSLVMLGPVSGGSATLAVMRARAVAEPDEDVPDGEDLTDEEKEAKRKAKAKAAAGKAKDDEEQATATGGGPALHINSTPEPAPKAKELVMTAPVTAPTASGAEAEVARLKGFNALRQGHADFSAKIDQWEAEGKSVDVATALVAQGYKDKLAAAPTLATGIARVDAPNESKRKFASAGEFYGAVMQAYSPGGVVDPRLFAAAQGMNQGVPAEGGFTVFPEYSSVIYEGLQSDPNALLPMTDNYTVTGESLTFPANAETSRATGSRFGGVQGYWINEAAQITRSTPKFRQVKVEPQQLAVMVYITEKLQRNNGVALEQYVNRAATEEITFLVGDAIYNGTGVGQPKGIMSSGALVTVSKESSQPNDTFKKANANKMWARLHPRSRANAVWLMNVDVEPQLDDFNTLVTNVAGTENVGGFGSQIYNADKNTLKGRPIIFCEFAGTLGDLGDVVLADMKGYVTGTRGAGVDTAMSMHLRFDYAEQAFRFMFEVDGQSWLASPLTPYKGANTLSSFVTLQAR